MMTYKSLRDVGNTRTRMYAGFHKALSRYASRQINNVDVTVFQIYWTICVTIIISVQKGYSKNKMVQFSPQHNVAICQLF